jgi:hypothetical protein
MGGTSRGLYTVKVERIVEKNGDASGNLDRIADDVG